MVGTSETVGQPKVQCPDPPPLHNHHTHTGRLCDPVTRYARFKSVTCNQDQSIWWEEIDELRNITSDLICNACRFAYLCEVPLMSGLRSACCDH